MTILCITSYFKGNDFLRQCKQNGAKVIFITSKSLEKMPWAWESIDEVFYMEEPEPEKWDLNHMLKGIGFLLQTRKIDAVAALDDFDVDKGALIRETFRIPGLGLTTHRYFRDKLAMRQQAFDSGIKVPAFSALFNNDAVNEFAQQVPSPWLIKPRGEASATGIKKIFSVEQLWQEIHALGDRRMDYLVEAFRPGKVHHVDTVTFKGKVMFSVASEYLQTPMEVSHEGGVFRTVVMNQKSKEAKKLLQLNEEVLKSFGMRNGASHTEFIQGQDGEYYFLETSARVGGAHIADMVEVSTGFNVWKEWANVEFALINNQEYKKPKYTIQPTGLVICLTKQQHPDVSKYTSDSVISIDMEKDYHLGLIVKSDSYDNLITKLNQITESIVQENLQIGDYSLKPLHQ